MPMINRSPDYRTPARVVAANDAGLCACETYTGRENGNCERCGKPLTKPISMLGGGRAGSLIAFTQAMESGRQ